MSMYGRDPWGGPLEIAADSATDDDRSRNLNDFDRAALSRPLDETQRSWLLGPGEQKKKKYVDLGCIIVSRKIFVWTLGTLLAAGFLAGFITLIVKLVPCHHEATSPSRQLHSCAPQGTHVLQCPALQTARRRRGPTRSIYRFNTPLILLSF